MLIITLEIKIIGTIIFIISSEFNKRSCNIELQFVYVYVMLCLPYKLTKLEYIYTYNICTIQIIINDQLTLDYYLIKKNKIK